MSPLRRKMSDRLSKAVLALLACGLCAGVYLAVRPPAAGPANASAKAQSGTPPAVPSTLTESDLKEVWGEAPAVASASQKVSSKVEAGSSDGLPFKVRGIVYSTSGASVAFIETGGKVILARTGDTVEGWALAGINAESATFTRGNIERVVALEYHGYSGVPTVASAQAFGGTPRQAAGAAATGAPSLAGKGKRFAPGASGSVSVAMAGIPAGAGAPRPAPTGADATVAVSPNDKELAQQDPFGALQGVTYQANTVDGKMNGFVLGKVPPTSMAARYTFAPGDKILAVNGQAIDSISRAMELYSNYRNSDSVRVTIERAGQKKDVMFYAR